MKRKILTLIFSLIAVLFFITIGCKKNSSSPVEPIAADTTGGAVERKPNIYLYPKVKSIISVKLEFPLGGTVIESIPTYTGEWLVEVEPNGRIDNKYDYLFYESRTSDRYQYLSGWVVQRDSLLMFFKTNLAKSGFTEREICDFTEYWISRLTDYSHYTIYPQYSDDINKVIKLQISKTPDNVLRLFYIIKGSTNSESSLLEPIIPVFKREGFVVAEWGVVIK